MEVLTALIHAQCRLGREFTPKEFKAGSVGQHLKLEDFKTPDQVIQIISFYLHHSHLLTANDFVNLL